MSDPTSCYINGVGVISPQGTFDNHEFLPEISSYHQNMLTSVVPDFRQYIPPNQIRRLSRMLRIGLSAAGICVQDGGGIKPDGIITGTGYGLQHDTEKFLKEMLDQEEKHLTPTFFMQSTYNALSGLVGLALQCTGYNNTYVSQGVAFEMALHDAMLQIAEKPESNFLVGGFDEANEVHYNVHARNGYFKQEKINSLELFRHSTTGSILGEGASFFLVSGKPTSGTWCEVAGLKMLPAPRHEDQLTADIREFLDYNQTNVSDVDALVMGYNGDPSCDQVIAGAASSDLRHIPQLQFKHLCGEYCTASAFSLWLAASLIKKQMVPDILVRDGSLRPTSPKTVLIINQYRGKNFSLVLLKP